MRCGAVFLLFLCISIIVEGDDPVVPEPHKLNLPVQVDGFFLLDYRVVGSSLVGFYAEGRLSQRLQPKRMVVVGADPDCVIRHSEELVVEDIYFSSGTLILASESGISHELLLPMLESVLEDACGFGS